MKIKFLGIHREQTRVDKISFQPRKRKAAEAITSPNHNKKLAQGIASAASEESRHLLIMDSDDEYISLSSDEDDVLLDESDDGSADGILNERLQPLVGL